MKLMKMPFRADCWFYYGGTELSSCCEPLSLSASLISLAFLARPKNSVSETLGMRALICHSPCEVALSGPQW
ncbi:hypothetical protein N7524_003614 [Penicillium chrysogenum]|nr:hypothetical protein N7524_003614 [Penicillium chrysogenum]